MQNALLPDNTLAAFEAERQHRKAQLAAACRLFARAGFEQGAAGHLSSRDPEWPDRFWLNPFGLSFARIKVSALQLIDCNGHIHVGQGKLNPAAVQIHSQIYRQRPDVLGITHAHSLYGKTWSALDRRLDPITQDACAFYEDHVLFSEFNGLVDNDTEGVALARSLGGSKAAILANHGLLTVGTSISTAAWWFLTMDRCCHSQLLAEAAGCPKVISPDVALRTRQIVGGEVSAERSFGALYEVLVCEEPGLLD